MRLDRTQPLVKDLDSWSDLTASASKLLATFVGPLSSTLSFLHDADVLASTSQIVRS